MKIMKPIVRRNRHEHRFHFRKLSDFCVYTGFLLLFVCVVPLILVAENTQTETSPAIANGAAAATEDNAQEAVSAENADGASSNNDDSTAEPTTEKITGTSKRMERYDKEGITILIDEAKTVRYNEQDVEIGFLNADKITLKADPETGATTEIIAVGNVEIRDQDIFATCDHATMDNLTNTIILKDNVVVLQNKDRLETKFFTFNKTTGKQTGEGGVKFKVTVTQAAPVDAEAEVAPVDTEGDENAESGASTGEEGTSTDPLEETESEVQKDAGTEAPNADGDTEEKPEADAGSSENADPEEETDANTDNPDDADADAETEESESN